MCLLILRQILSPAFILRPALTKLSKRECTVDAGVNNLHLIKKKVLNELRIK